MITNMQKQVAQQTAEISTLNRKLMVVRKDKNELKSKFEALYDDFHKYVSGSDSEVNDGNENDGNEDDGNEDDGNGVDENGDDGNGVDGNEDDGNGVDENGVDGNRDKNRSEIKSESEVKSEAGSASEVKSEAGSASEVKSEAGSGSRSRSEAGSKARSEVKSEAGSRSVSESASEIRTEVQGFTAVKKTKKPVKEIEEIEEIDQRAIQIVEDLNSGKDPTFANIVRYSPISHQSPAKSRSPVKSRSFDYIAEDEKERVLFDLNVELEHQNVKLAKIGKGLDDVPMYIIFNKDHEYPEYPEPHYYKWDLEIKNQHPGTVIRIVKKALINNNKDNPRGNELYDLIDFRKNVTTKTLFVIYHNILHKIHTGETFFLPVNPNQQH